MKKIDSYKLLFLVIFVLAALLRVSLALVNTKANDNHFQVIQIIKQENRIPVNTDWLGMSPAAIISFYFRSFIKDVAH